MRETAERFTWLRKVREEFAAAIENMTIEEQVAFWRKLAEEPDETRPAPVEPDLATAARA